MTRRSPQEIAAELESRAAKMKADAERRLAVASDPQCQLLWDAERAVLALREYAGPETWEDAYAPMMNELRTRREIRWAELKARGRA